MSSRYRLLVFDWDGTLMDSVAQIVGCLQQVIMELNLVPRPNAALSNIIGLGLPESVLNLYPDADENYITTFIDCYRKHFLSSQLPQSRLFDGALETIKQLHTQGYLLAVATGKSRRGLQRSLTKTGSTALFHATRCADESISKPHPQMLLEIMDVLDVIPEETLMIGDTEYDLLMANQAGTDALAVDYGVHERLRLLALQPRGCLSDIREIIAWLKNA